MSAPDDIPSMSPARKREKSSSGSESMSQPSTTPPVERPSTSNGHESGHFLGGHGHGHSQHHSSGQLGNHHHMRRPSAGHSSTDSRSSSHGDGVRRLSSMRDRVLVSNANAMARGMSLSELEDTTTTTTTSSSSSPHMNGHNHSNTDNDQQQAGTSNGSRKKKKKKRHWHRSSYDSDLIGWTGLYPNLSKTTDKVLDSNPELDAQEKSVEDDSKEPQPQVAADSSTSSLGGKRQGMPLENQVKQEEEDEHPNEKTTAKEKDQLAPPLSKRQKNEPPVRSLSRSMSLDIQDTLPKHEQATTSRSKSQDSLIDDNLGSPKTLAKKEERSQEEETNSQPPLSVTKSETPSPNAVEPEVVYPKVAEPEVPSPSVAEPLPQGIEETPPPGVAEEPALAGIAETHPLDVAEPAPPGEAEPSPLSVAEPPLLSVAETPPLGLDEPPPSEIKMKLLPNNNNTMMTTVKLKATDEFYRLPFSYGWRRELVLPSLGNPKRRTGDVFFISPSGRKLRSREDIIPLLEGDLTIQHFCFQRASQEVGPQYEVVRRATPALYRSKQNEASQEQDLAVTGKRVPKPKVPKGASPPSEGWTSTAAVKGKVRSTLSSNGGNLAVAVSRKQSKVYKVSSSEKERESEIEQQQQQPVALPVDVFEVSDDTEEDNDDTPSSSGSAMEIAEEIELPGQMPPSHLFEQEQEQEYRPLRDMDVVVIGGRKAIFVRGPPQPPLVKLVPRLPDLTSYDRIYRKRIQDKRMGQTLAISLNDAHIGVNVLAAVMKTLNMKERVTISQVCTTWAMVSRDNRVWNKVILRDTYVGNWIKLLTEMARHRTRELDMMGVIMTTPKLRFTGELRIVKSLRSLRTDATTNEFLKLVLTSLPQLQELRTTCVSSHLHLGRLERMRKLRVLRINMTHPKAQALHINAVQNLSHLTELSIRGVANLQQLDLMQLKLLTRLQVLGLGSCEYLNHEQLGREVLPCLKALHTVRIENDHRAMAMFPVDEILRGLSLAGGVQRLELINVDVDSGFGQLLASCGTVTHLLLAPKCLHNTATMTNAVMQAIRDNANHLAVFRLVLVTQLLSATENLYKGTQKNVIPVQRPVPGIPYGDALNHCSPEDNCQEEEHTQCVAFLPVERLEAILNEMMPIGYLSVAKVAMSETTNVQFLKPGVTEST
ncbi:nucleolar protein dao-5 isoform X2 [Drosophila kikkawai]|uniref:Nucleolar protein dao-5 isoform X2 n=1 Tax=Drosophila kikkawai TaxID=30033 RepID=A0A6P4JPE2_DROKI|nr:uncharacterized protein LOC108084658 isoform X2 [Drosophila kikkawai]